MDNTRANLVDKYCRIRKEHDDYDGKLRERTFTVKICGQP